MRWTVALVCAGLGGVALNCGGSSRSSRPRSEPEAGRAGTLATKRVGSIDGMTNWDGNFVYDEAASAVHALGHGPDIDDNYLFTTQLRTRSTSSILLAPSDTGAIYYTVGGLDPRGRLVAAYWDGEKELLVTIDPADASTNVVGSLGDLKSWDNQLVYNPTLSAVVALGWSPSNVAHLYATVIDR